jgi:hypothetical protein
VTATGSDATRVAAQLAEALRDPALQLALVFADWRLDAATLARDLDRALGPAPVVGGSATGVIGPGTERAAPGACAAVALGLYGDEFRVGVGLATDLAKSPLTRARDAVTEAAAALGTPVVLLDATRHVAITLIQGRCGHEEAFCIGSAAAAPQIRMIGGATSTELPAPHQPAIWARGEVWPGAAAVMLLDTELPFYPVTSAHLVPTPVRTVVTAATGRTVTELDGRPAVSRLRQLVAQLGDELDLPRPTRLAFARYLGNVPYVRSITHAEGEAIVLASFVEPGHVLRLMRPGDLVGATRRDLAIAAERVGGSIGALVAVSCLGRHGEAATRGLDRELADAYAAYPTVGYQSFGEQSGTILVNHTLTGLALGVRR